MPCCGLPLRRAWRRPARWAGCWESCWLAGAGLAAGGCWRRAWRVARAPCCITRVASHGRAAPPAPLQVCHQRSRYAASHRNGVACLLLRRPVRFPRVRRTQRSTQARFCSQGKKQVEKNLDPPGWVMAPSFMMFGWSIPCWYQWGMNSDRPWADTAKMLVLPAANFLDSVSMSMSTLPSATSGF